MFGFHIDKERARDIITLAAPIMIAMLTQTGINIVDTMFVGKLDPSYSIPGQAALGFSLPLFWSMGGFLAAIGVGTQAMTARRYGESHYQDAGVVLANALFVSALASLAVTTAGWFTIPYIFPALTSNQSVLEIGIPYAQVRILGIVGMVATTAYKGFFDGLGKTRVHMWACILMNGINIGFNYALIFGLGPIPAFHVTGAAIASALSTFIGLFFMWAWTQTDEIKEQFQSYRLQNLQPKIMWRVSKLSLPSGAAQVFMMSGVLLFLKIIALLDERAIHTAVRQASIYQNLGAFDPNRLFSALTRATEMTGRFVVSDWTNTILWSRPPIFTTASKLIIDLLTVGFVTCVAFGQATATLVSQHMGKGEFDRAEDYGWDSVKIGMLFFGTIGLLAIIFPTYFLGALSDDPTVIQTAVPGLRIMASLEMFVAMALILTQALFGAGNTLFVMYTQMTLHALCLVPVTYLLAIWLGLGFIGVWLSATLYIVALALIMAWKFWEGSWKEIDV